MSPEEEHAHAAASWAGHEGSVGRNKTLEFLGLVLILSYIGSRTGPGIFYELWDWMHNDIERRCTDVADE